MLSDFHRPPQSPPAHHETIAVTLFTSGRHCYLRSMKQAATALRISLGGVPIRPSLPYPAPGVIPCPNSRVVSFEVQIMVWERIDFSRFARIRIMKTVKLDNLGLSSAPALRLEPIHGTKSSTPRRIGNPCDEIYRRQPAVWKDWFGGGLHDMLGTFPSKLSTDPISSAAGNQDSLSFVYCRRRQRPRRRLSGCEQRARNPG